MYSELSTPEKVKLLAMLLVAYGTVKVEEIIGTSVSIILGKGALLLKYPLAETRTLYNIGLEKDIVANRVGIYANISPRAVLFSVGGALATSVVSPWFCATRSKGDIEGMCNSSHALNREVKGQIRKRQHEYEQIMSHYCLPRRNFTLI